ncbi:cytochrome c oxidase assembly factor CtaG [Pseudonocardia sediminis]|uniref:Cytochrome c oxidase assembly factor CtaG n=1 Tax=Pseudonocardia sediminis TaxID=1397368 RepID=A0A4Q7UUQ9_PSEST|nr:cytochrome c oxidase assembly protein [Pseudonocardia sediminis]RZT85622.1 cytochrome c oxidase assembly factor CtaG [Pseudonocardia sediminis]
MNPAFGGTDTLPPPLDLSRVLTSWTVEPWVLFPVVVLGIAYLLGVRTVRRRGVAWQRSRTVMWFVGLAIIALSTSSVIGEYDNALFSMTAVQHMLLQMVAPTPLGLAAPVTLALRALRGHPRRTLLAVTHSRYLGVLTHPVVAYTLFVVTPFIVIYSPLFELSVSNPIVHNLMHLHFVLVGALLYWPLLGIDPFPNPLPYAMRLLLVFGLGPAHIVLGIPIMLRKELIAPDFFLRIAEVWGSDPFADQKTGGAILWIFGDVVVLLLLAGMFVQWNRSEHREQRRVDRHLDRLHGEASSVAPWWVTDDPRAARRLPDFVQREDTVPAAQEEIR